MPISDPLRLDRLQKGVFSVLEDAMAPADVGWAYGQAAFEQRGADLVNITMSNGPSYWTQKSVRGLPIQPFDDITIDVTAATADVRDVISVNCIDYFVDVIAQTPEQIRDEFIVLLNADAGDPWAVTPGGNPSELVLTPTSFGDVWSIELTGELAALSQTLSGEIALLTQGTRVFTITIECFSKNRFPRNGAWSLMSKIEGVFEAEEYIQTLDSFGVAVWDKGIATDISAIAGANWESRVTLDVQMAMRSALVRPVDQIETVQGTINALGDESTIIATQTFTVAAP